MSEQHKLAYEDARNFMRTSGIVSIIFGGIASLIALGVIGLYAWMSLSASTQSDAIVHFIEGILAFIFFFIPTLFTVCTGYALLRHPAPKVALTLTIISLSIAAILMNYVVVVFLAILLSKMRSYEVGYNL